MPGATTVEVRVVLEDAVRTRIAEEAHGAALPGRRHRERTDKRQQLLFVSSSNRVRRNDIPTRPAIATGE
jgi:hypothetical protein